MTIFSERIQPLIPIGPFPQNKARLRETVSNLIADGGTAVYDATAQAFEQVRADATPERINAVVVLTDGEDTDSTAGARRRGAHGSGAGRLGRPGARVHDRLQRRRRRAPSEALEAIAKASGGQPYEGDTEDIESVYRSISSFF